MEKEAADALEVAAQKDEKEKEGYEGKKNLILFIDVHIDVHAEIELNPQHFVVILLIPFFQ